MYLDSITGRRWPLFAARIWSFGEDSLKELVPTRANEIPDILDERVLVLVRHTGDIVHHISSVMLDKELSSS